MGEKKKCRRGIIEERINVPRSPARFSSFTHFFSLYPSLNPTVLDREAPGRVQQDQRQVPGPHPGERVLVFFFKPLANERVVRLGQPLTVLAPPFLSSSSLLWPLVIDSNECTGHQTKGKRDGERAGEEYESPQGIANVIFCLVSLLRPQQPRFVASTSTTSFRCYLLLHSITRFTHPHQNQNRNKRRALSTRSSSRKRTSPTSPTSTRRSEFG